MDAVDGQSKTKAGKGKTGGKNGQDARAAYYDRISKLDMAPLWVVLKDIIPEQPKTVCAPAIWRYKDVRPYVSEAGSIITAQEASRRVLVLENPLLRGKSRITQSLYAGLQLILPGEIAPPHRHAASAIRFILDGEGAYTQVDGEKTIMSPGDFVLTPFWTIHDHGNTSKKSMMWLDVLDVPTVNFFETSFYEHFDEEKQNTKRDHEDSLMRYGSGVLPDGTDRTPKNSPIINYPVRPDAADPRSARQGRRHRSAPRRALPLRQSGHRRLGAADHGRASRRCCRRASRARTTRRPTAPSSSASKARARPRSAARCSSGDRRTCSSSRRG